MEMLAAVLVVVTLIVFCRLKAGHLQLATCGFEKLKCNNVPYFSQVWNYVEN